MFLFMFAVLDPLKMFTISSAGSKAPDFVVGFGGSSMPNGKVDEAHLSRK